MPQVVSGIETGWISKWAFQAGALSADSVGREAMADGFITAAKIGSNALASISHVGVYGLDFYDMAVYG